MSRGTVAMVLAVGSCLGYAVLGVIGLVATGPEPADPVSMLLFGAAVAAFSAMGALLIRRVPANAVGTLLLATAVAQTAGLGLLTYGGLGGSAAPPWPGAAVVAAFGDVWYTAPFVIALIGVPLLFPDGRLPSPRFRWVVRVTAAGMALQGLVGLASLVHGPAVLDLIAGVLTGLSVAAIVFGVVGAGVAISTRFRRGTVVQRQQVKWLLAVASVAAVAFPAALILGSSQEFLALGCWAIGFLAYLALPVAIGLAILRYHLYEIDRIISRTIGYAVVTVTLAAVFSGAILVFQALLAPLTGGNTLAVAGSTLVVAALFQPLRGRVQRTVDHRFNRARYHAELTVAAFVTQLRDEVDLDSLNEDVMAAVAQSVAPATVSVWLRRSGIEA